MKKKLILLITILFTSLLTAQVGIGTTSPQAALEIESTDDGLLIPRVALADAATPTLITPTVSELVYNTAVSGAAELEVTPGYYYWDGMRWLRLVVRESLNENVWMLTGNSATDTSYHFMGTTDDVDVVFKRNNLRSGMLSSLNTSFGVQSLKATQGDYNTAIGRQALTANTTGNRNTALGNNALLRNTAGYRNTALGHNALIENTVGYSNTGVGLDVMNKNTEGYHNSAFGVSALMNNQTGNENTAVGTHALFTNTSGNFNTAVGAYSLFYNELGIQNVGVGRYSLANNTIGGNNTALGFQSLYFNTTGGANTGIGMMSLSNNTIGHSNTAVGLLSLQNNTEGIYNTALGRNALNDNTVGDNNTALGYNALETVTGNNNIGLGSNAQVPIAANSNQIRLGDSNITYAGTEVAWSITSDVNSKSDVRSLDTALSVITKLNPVIYRRTNDASQQQEYGLIAQELEATLKAEQLPTNGIITVDDDGNYSLRYNDLIAILIRGMQEQQFEINRLKQLINEPD